MTFDRTSNISPKFVNNVLGLNSQPDHFLRKVISSVVPAIIKWSGCEMDNLEASRKLRLSASQTMRLAQKLYEGVEIGGDTVGLITYMRTDGTNLSDEAISQARSVIKNRFGDKYLPDAPRQYKAKAKNAQEAHEAIRPTDVTRTPKEMAQYLDGDMLRLYELVWKRMVASQMESALYDQLVVDIGATDGKAMPNSTATV